jgi:uracil-DNA glycosylase family 4
MDANQTARSNPYGMDETCEQCPSLCETRTQIVHGYGDVGAEFVVIGTAPDAAADQTGVPFGGDSDASIIALLDDLGFLTADSPAGSGDGPPVENVYLTYLTRCRHPDRGPTDAEVRNCDGFLSAELRMINPEVLLPVGQRPLEALALEYTTRAPDSFDVDEEHATTIRGRGFELVPMVEPSRQSPAEQTAIREHLAALLDRDYRQTKGRRRR